jgi:hypothetical protein
MFHHDQSAFLNGQTSIPLQPLPLEKVGNHREAPLITCNKGGCGIGMALIYFNWIVFVAEQPRSDQLSDISD